MSTRRATRVAPLVQPLESRQMMAVDLTVTALTPGNLPASLTAGAKVTKTPSANITVSNVGDTAFTKKSKGAATVTVTLHPTAGGSDIVLGSAKINANKLLSPASTKVTFSKLKTLPAAGDYQIVASVAGLGDANTANNTFSTNVTIGAAPSTGGNNGGGTSTGALSVVGLGNKLTFKKKQGVSHNGIGFEQGTWKDDKGNSGSFYHTFNGTQNPGFLGLTQGTTPKAGILVHANSGLPTVGGKTLTFLSSSAGSKGYIEVAGQTIYYK